MRSYSRFVFSLSLGVASLLAQPIRFELNVVDVTGAVVTSATASLACGNGKFAPVLSGSGLFLVHLPSAAECTLSVSAPGFKAKVIKGMRIESRPVFRTTVQLDVGSVAEAIEVQAGGMGKGGGVGYGMGGGYGPGSGGKISAGMMGGLSFPASRFSTENYRKVGENGFIPVKQQALSTFSIDADTASFSNTRRFLREGQLPPPDAVRVEEFLNNFRYSFPAPAGPHPVAVHTEAGPCPWQPKHQLAMVGLKTKALDSSDLPPANLVFLLDVSGSMNDPRKLPLLKQSFSLLVEQLRPEDSVGIVVYAGSSGALLEGAKGNEKQRILDVLDRLQAGGSTNGASGIVLAYQLAEKTFRKGGNNRVILATDGDFNVGVSSDGDLVRLIEEKRKSGIFLTVLGYGMGNYKDGKLEQLANAGNGNYAYIDEILEARKFLVKEFGQNLVTVAKDVKLQVEFNPRHVKEYRLIGYENRLMQAQEFRDDKKDAGELGSGHSVVALYEIVPHTAESMAGEVEDLRYQREAKDERKHKDELFFVRVRYKAPGADEAKEFASPMESKKVEGVLALTSADFRFAAGIAEFAQVLSKSKWGGASSLENARALIRGSLAQAPDEQRALVPGMIDRAIELGSQARQRSSLE